MSICGGFGPKKTGRQVKFRPSSWAETLEGLRAGEADIHSGLSYSKERAEWIDYSMQIYETYTGVYHRAGDNQPITIGDYGENVVGTQFGTYQDTAFRSAFPNISVRSFGTTQELIDALLKDKIKAVVLEELIMEAELDRLGLRSEIISRPERLLPSTIHAGVLKGNEELLKQINDGFAAVTREKLADLEKRWIQDPEDNYYKSDTRSIVLSPDEKSWLREHPVIEIFIPKDLTPYSFIDDLGTVSGLTADVIQLFSKKLGVDLKINITGDHEIINGIKQSKINVASYFGDPGSDSYTASIPYASLDYAMFVKTDTVDRPFSFEKFTNKKIAMYKGVEPAWLGIDNLLQNRFIYYNSVEEGLKAVKLGDVDAWLDIYQTANYAIKKRFLTDLEAVYIRPQSTEIKFYIKNDFSELLSIFNKTISACKTEELPAIFEKWAIYLTPEQSAVKLTKSEHSWLTEHPVVRVAMDQNWAPVEFADDQGRFHGISMDYLKQLGELIGIRFEVAEGITWQEAIAAVESGELDLLPSMARTPEREARYAFTDPYLSMPINIFTGGEVTYIGGLEALNEKRVAVVDGYAIHEWLRLNHPEIKLVPAKSNPAALKMLAAGEVDAFVGNVVTTSYYISKLRLNQIRVAGETPYKYDQAMAVRQDWQILTSILQKAIDTIPQSERETIYNRWVSVKYEHGFDYSLLWKILAPVFLVIMLFFYWNQRLRREVHQRHQAEAELKRDEERLGALLRLSQTKDVEEEQLIKSALDECVRSTSSEFGHIHFVNPDQETMKLGVWSNNIHEYCNVEENHHYSINESSIWADCVHKKKPVVYNDYPVQSVRNNLPDGHVLLNRYMSIPVADGDKIVMVVGIGNKENPYTDTDIRQLTLFMQSMWGIVKEKRTEETLQFTQFAVDRASDAAFWIDSSARFVYANDIACQVLGYSKEEMMNMSIHNIDPNYPMEIWSDFWSETKKRRYNNIESTHKTRDGRSFPVDIRANYVEFGGKEIICAFARDVSERKKAEEDQRRNMEELELFTNMAVGREEKMIELKKEINDLLCQLDKDEKYDIVE